MLFRFFHPDLLWLLLLVPLAAILIGRTGRKATLLFPATALARHVSRQVRGRPGRLSHWLKILALTAGILALARPQAGTENRSQRFEGIDILLTVDLSSSMWAHDFDINGVPSDRLTAVKSVMEEFIQARRHDRIGLVAFAGHPYLVSPLTINHPWLLSRLRELEIAMIEDGTAIGSAIGSSVNRLQERADETRVIVLLTDGANNRGQINPMQAAEAAAALGIRVYTVGVGQEGPAPFPRLDPRTGQPIRDRAGKMTFGQAPPDLDLPMLQAIADRTGGRFFHARNTDELETVYAEIDALEKTEVDLQTSAVYRDWFAIPLGLCLTFYLVDWILGHTRYRRLP